MEPQTGLEVQVAEGGVQRREGPALEEVEVEVVKSRRF